MTQDIATVQTDDTPYLAPDRLPKLIAAIQAMGTVGWGSAPIEQWVREFEGAEEMATEKRRQYTPNKEDCKKWREIFTEHPEFFKLYTLDGIEKAALRWRFAQPIDYNPTTGKSLSAAELRRIKRDDKFYAAYTRRPLSADQIDVLIKTAIDLHSRVIAAQQERRWHWPIVATIITSTVGAIFGLLGVVVGAFLKAVPK